MRTRRLIVTALATATLYGCNRNPQAASEHVLKTQFGDATYYARHSQGKPAASGRKFDNRKPFAAHRTYPFGTIVRVTNRLNGRSVEVVIVDRGPYGQNRREGTIIDLSREAAKALGILHAGQVPVKLEVLSWGTG